MADIVILVHGNGPAGSGDNIRYSGSCRLSGMTPESEGVTWSVDVPPGALASTINTAIKDAAVAAAEAAEYTVGALDKKTLIGGAVGL